MKYLGTYRIEAQAGWKAIGMWKRHHLTICKMVTLVERTKIRICAEHKELMAELRAFQKKTFTYRQVARYFGVTVNWLEFVVNILHRLHPDQYGRFPGAELERFVREDFDLIHANRLITRNDNLVRKMRTEGPQQNTRGYRLMAAAHRMKSLQRRTRRQRSDQGVQEEDQNLDLGRRRSMITSVEQSRLRDPL